MVSVSTSIDPLRSYLLDWPSLDEEAQLLEEIRGGKVWRRVQILPFQGKVQKLI